MSRCAEGENTIRHGLAESRKTSLYLIGNTVNLCLGLFNRREFYPLPCLNFVQPLFHSGTQPFQLGSFFRFPIKRLG